MASEGMASATPPYVLEKIPNLLCFNLLLPLVDKAAPVEEAQAVSKRLGASRGQGGLPPAVAQPSGKVPAMLATRTGESSCVVTIYGLNQSIYAQIPLDCWVDIDRSSLTLRGDHLVARLAFTHYNIAYNTRVARDSMYPSASELQVESYADGIQCRRCHANVAAPLSSIHRAPQLPWGELIECLTCVRVEQYLGMDSVDPAFVVQDRRVAPRPGAAIVSETMLCINEASCSAVGCKKVKATSDVPPLLLGEHESAAGWTPVECAHCQAWLGDSLHEEIRLYKFAIDVRSSAFSKYAVHSVLAGAMVDAANSRECYRCVLTGPHSQIACGLVLLSAESWLATRDAPQLVPALKVLYWKDAAFIQPWAHSNGAEWVVLRSADLCAEIVAALDRINLELPHSARSMKDGSLVSFLKW